MTFTTRDGVTLVHAQKPGPTTVNLMFRVGQADERLAERGITHLVEHLALFPLGIRDHHSNGQTGTHVTTFHATGTASEVTSFLAAVCSAVNDLPVERLESEKLVLRTEASQRGAWTFADLAIWRHGAVGDARPAYMELGRDAVTPEQLGAWRDRYFTAGNAVLLVVGPEVPDDLRLSLAPGPRRPVVPVHSIIPEGRSCFASGQGAVMFDAVVERSLEASIAAQVLNKLLYQELRLDSAFSYSAGCGYQPRDGRVAVITGYADALDEQSDALVGATVDLLARIRRGRFDDEVVTGILGGRIEATDDPEFVTASVAGHAFDLLMDGEPMSVDTYRSGLVAMRPDDVRHYMGELLGNVMLQVPAGRRADWAGYQALPRWSSRRVQATSIYRYLDERAALHLGPEGISRVDGVTVVTVLYAACAVCLAWPDGRRELIGDDGFVVAIEPNLLEQGSEAVERIDRDVDQAQVVVQPARDAEDIPAVPVAPETEQRSFFRRRKSSR